MDISVCVDLFFTHINTLSALFYTLFSETHLDRTLVKCLFSVIMVSTLNLDSVRIRVVVPLCPLAGEPRFWSSAAPVFKKIFRGEFERTVISVCCNLHNSVAEARAVILTAGENLQCNLSNETMHVY